MVSFCDIPLTRTYEFTSRYGNHAIGLSKDWASNKNITPILYINNSVVLSSLRTYKSIVENSGNPDSCMCNLLGLMKKYVGANPRNNKDQCNYEENEWRYIVDEDQEGGVVWKWSDFEYREWRGEDKKPSPLPQFTNYKLSFEIKDISYIIVEFERQIPDLIKSLEKYDQIGGSNSNISEDDKKILFSKIISMERVKADF